MDCESEGMLEVRTRNRPLQVKSLEPSAADAQLVTALELTWWTWLWCTVEAGTVSADSTTSHCKAPFVCLSCVLAAPADLWMLMVIRSQEKVHVMETFEIRSCTHLVSGSEYV